tara:strand:- start:8 stop:214 length:207 start_codon:yes stop_codon:yes gene_type:complete
MKINEINEIETACEFGTWLFEEMYTLTWQDVDSDGKIWSNYENDDLHLKREKCKRYTIEELYTKFINK